MYKVIIITKVTYIYIYIYIVVCVRACACARHCVVFLCVFFEDWGQRKANEAADRQKSCKRKVEFPEDGEAITVTIVFSTIFNISGFSLSRVRRNFISACAVLCLARYTAGNRGDDTGLSRILRINKQGS